MTAHDAFTSAQAAAYLSVSEKTMRRLRASDKGPGYRRESSGLVVYSREELDAWRNTQFIATIIYAPIEQRGHEVVAA